MFKKVFTFISNNDRIKKGEDEMKINRKIKKIFNVYNIAVLACIIIIAVSVYVIFKPETKQISKDSNNAKEKIEIIKSDTKEITEEKARKLAKKQFKKLGENVKENELNVEKIQRKGEYYFYITSEKNTLEIKIDSGKITRINSVAVE